jgi:Putative beta-barrel porin 2
MMLRAAPLAALWLAAAVTPAVAADLVISPRLSQSLGYDTNVDLSTNSSGSGGDSQGAGTATTSASVSVARKAPAAELELNGRVDFTQNFAGRSNSYNGEYLDGVLSRSFSPRTQAQLQAGFASYDSLDNIVDSTGRNLDRNQRTYNVNIGPSVSHRLTPLDTAVVSGSWSRQLYDKQDEDQGNDNIDTSYWRSNLGWRRILSQRATGGLNLAGSHIDSARDDTWTISPQVYFSYVEERRIDVSFSVGPQAYWSSSQEQQFDGTLADQDNNGFGASVQATIDYQATQRLDLTVDLSHDIEPGGNTGVAAEVTTAVLGARHALTRRLDLVADGTYQRRNTLGSTDNAVDDDDRDFLQAQLGIVYALSPSVDLSLNYRYRYQKFDGDSDSADSNAVFVRVDWRLPDWRPFR